MNAGEYQRGYTMEHQQKQTTQGTQDEDKQNKRTTQYVFDTTICKHTYIM
jgi:hypothetical protein